MRALVLSGGGSKGAYQAGVIRVLLGEQRINYALYAGVSVGALNAAFLAQFPHEKVVEAAEALAQFWGRIKTTDIRKRWFPFGKLHGFWESAIYNSAPLRQLIVRNLSQAQLKESGKRLVVGTVALDSGNLGIFTEQDPDIVEGVYASASFPMGLDVGRLRGTIWTDGGVRDVTPLKAAIQAGATAVDVVLTSPPDPIYWDEKNPNALQRGIRELEIMLNEVQENDLRICNWINAAVAANAAEAEGRRYIKLRIFRPETALSMASLDFESDVLAQAMLQGQADARQVLADFMAG